MRVIGFSGKAGSGKNEAARALRLPTFAFAWTLKETANTLFNWPPGIEKDVVDPFWGVAPRDVYQWLGTATREKFVSYFWIKRLFYELEHVDFPIVAITDVRYPDEVRAIEEKGGQVYRIERPGHSILTPKQALHSSETALDDWPWRDEQLIRNIGTLEEFHAEVKRKVLL